MPTFMETHSIEVHEIISRPPHWLLGWGVTLTFVFMILGVLVTWLIRYPDLVAASFILTSKDAPRRILTRNAGRIQTLLASDGSIVKAGQPLVYSESSANHEQVLCLELELIKLYEEVNSDGWTKVHNFFAHEYSELGELQISFQAFYQQFEQLKTVLVDGYLVRKRELLLEDVADLKAMEVNIIEQQDLQMRDYELASEEFKIQERLFKEKVIPILELNREKAKLLSRELPLNNLKSSLIQNRTSQTAKQKELLELDNTISQQKSATLQALHTLRSGIALWKQNYVIYAPVGGRLSFIEPWQEQQHVTTGQELMTVEPDGRQLRGLLKVSQVNLGKLRHGQKVLMKLEGYPYQEYGMLEGTLAHLSPTPGKDSMYWGYIDLPRGLVTRYDKQLTYKNGMKGIAEIITKERRLAERLLTMIRDGGKQRND